MISRQNKEGYGTAFIEGFKWGLSKDYDYLISIDGDFSYRIEDLINLYNTKDFDLIIGSRYTNGGNTLGWSLHRKLFSKYANKMANSGIKSCTNDMTTGLEFTNLT